MAESAHAKLLISRLFETIRPQKSYISLLSFKYHIAIVLFLIRLLRGQFAIGLILLQKQGFLQIGLCSRYRFEASEVVM